MKSVSIVCLIAPAAILMTAATAAAHGRNAGPDGWSTAVPVANVNSAAADGCPIESPDGRRLFLASTRAGALNDIYVAERLHENDRWSTPTALPAPVNTEAADFCPTPLTGGRLLFVSTRTDLPHCNTSPGAGDIYSTRLHPVRPPTEPVNLGCVADGTGPNFAGPEFSPSLVTTDAGTWLYFSSTGSLGQQDIYMSTLGADGRFGAPQRIEELSTGSVDQMPNVSPDGRVIVFVSNRPVNGVTPNLDVYMSVRASVSDPWEPPVRLGPEVNGPTDESRPSMSADGHRLYFGRAGDIFISTRG